MTKEWTDIFYYPCENIFSRVSQPFTPRMFGAQELIVIKTELHNNISSAIISLISVDSVFSFARLFCIR